MQTNTHTRAVPAPERCRAEAGLREVKKQTQPRQPAASLKVGGKRKAEGEKMPPCRIAMATASLSPGPGCCCMARRLLISPACEMQMQAV